METPSFGKIRSCLGDHEGPGRSGQDTKAFIKTTSIRICIKGMYNEEGGQRFR